jgi:hypothetical protein
VANLRFSYLYRDGSNYKKWADVVFSNPDGLTCEVLRKEFAEAFLTDGLFIAHQVRIPEAFLWRANSIDPDDHCFHEFDGIEDTDDTPDDRYGRSIVEFADEVAANASQGWKAFEPSDRA